MAINVNSEAFCRKAYLNYHCYGNTMGISAEDMGKITQAWSDRISSWQATVSSDENEYEFDDSEYARYKSEGKEAGIEVTKGDQSNTTGQIVRGTTDATSSVGGYVGATVGKKTVTKAVTESAKAAVQNIAKGVGTEASKTILGKAVGKAAEQAAEKVGVKAAEEAAKKAAEEAAKKAAEKGAEEAAKKAAEEAAKKAAEEAAKKATEATALAAKNVGKAVGCIIGCVVGAATATAYWVKNPNKEEKQACDALQTEMAGAQSTLSETQSEMEYMSEEIIALSDEANYTNEDTNEEIEEQKSQYDMYMASYLALQDKLDAGEPLTDSEKELYKEVVGYLGEIGGTIEEISEDTTDVVSDLYDEIGSYQEGYDVAAETMGEIEGLTDYAASFDEATQIMCYVEGGAQTLNAASSGKASYQAFALASSGSWAFGATAWAYAFGVMGAAGAAGSTAASMQQFSWAGQVGTEIEMRKATQDLNTETMDLYTEEIDAYDGMMQGVEDLELEIPDETAPPEGVGDPNGVESTEYTNYTEILEGMEEGSKVVTENEDGTGRAMIAPQYGTAIATTLGLPDQTQGGKFGKEAIPAILAKLIPGQSPEDILKVMNGGTLDSSYDASLIQTTTGEDTGKDTTVNNSEKATANLRTIINFYKPILEAASLKGWKC